MKPLALIVFALFTVTFSMAWERYDKCDSDYEKVGCYNDNAKDRALPLELLNERDRSNKHFDGHKIDWKNFTGYISGLACRCAAKSREEGYEFFGLQFYGECWSGKGDYSKHKEANQAKQRKCIPDYVNKCNDQDKAVCVGTQHINYVYRLKKSVDGGYSDWSDWTTCSKSCGDGVQQRVRKCTNPRPSGNGKDCTGLGPENQTKSCKKEDCIPDVDGGYSDWSDWTTCSKSCGDGVQQRSRTCTNPKPSGNGKNCSGLGSDKETKPCKLQDCIPDVDGGYGEWSEWEPCSKSCGGGVTKRTRSCDYPKPQGNGEDCSVLGSSVEKQACEVDMCPVPCKNILDVGIVLDGSSSIRRSNFAKAKEVIQDLAGYLNVSPQGTHIGLILYSTDVVLKHSFFGDQDLDEVKKAIAAIRYPKGRTYTSQAIERAGEDFFTLRDTGNRADVPDLLIVFTDGSNTDGITKLRNAVNAVNLKDVHTLAVGIGRYANEKELTIIAHQVEDNVIIAKNFDVLKKKLGAILARSCSYGNSPSNYY